MKKSIKFTIKLLSLVMVVSMSLGAVFATADGKKTAETVGAAARDYFSRVFYPIENDITAYFDQSVVSKLPETVADDDEISVIVKMSVNSVLDEYAKTDGSMTVAEFANGETARKISENVANETNNAIAKLNKSGISYSLGEKFDVLLGGFEVTVKANQFNRLEKLFAGDATLIIGDTYEKCETEVVTNYVEVYKTGIFDSSDSEYQGDGVVVAVLDTGLDYTHTAFSVNNFTTSKEEFTLDTVSDKISQTAASRFSYGLTGEDVYVSAKVPFAYDYADKDPDVLPINSEHGTHVAGIIAGKDDEITGVAPNAQLAIMKVFSDIAEGAKSSWLLAALEDCVVLGVDVINMSLGSSCGFTREDDKVAVAEIYDRIGEAGISLITAGSNSYNATFSSKKNGTNGLTKHPDSGTVGSPATYMSSLSVASVDGVMTPYLLYGDQIIYFNEASTSAAKTKDFVNDLLDALGGVDQAEVEYVTIPGIGRASDYFAESNDYYKGKIVLVKRGTTTFEEKVRIALKDKGAAGIIIYNNISGTISMSVGADMGAVCSISQDDGEMLAASTTGKLFISRNNVAGPFMSDFSSWGPTSDLKIKPEITAHGGEIYSAVPGQSYDRLSGTSMACPNQAGATALIRQYVKSGKFGQLSPTEVTATVNKLMTSTADIVYNRNGLPYSVRKQGAGLINIKHSYQTAAYVTTFDADGNPLDKSKLELGDDKTRSGEYVMTFDVTNVSSSAVTYDLGAIVMTEGVSKTYTGHNETTVTMDGYMLDGATNQVTNVVGGTQNGNKVTVSAGETAKVTFKITLSDKDKEYLNKSFQYGMYVEGFVTMKAVDGTQIDMNVPYLAFYGNWMEAPIFDEEYYDTNVDEVNPGIDEDDKLMADAYATRVIGGLYTDYIATLGSYYFVQNPSATQIAADKDKISLSNQQTGGSGSALNSLRDIWAGMMRNAKIVDIVITEDATGEVIFERTNTNQRKSQSSGGEVRQSSIEVEFDVLSHNLKNNTRYTVTVSTYIDYGTKEEQDEVNARNTFTFPLYIDFEAPVVTDVVYRTEYDRSSKKTSLYADIYVYDNHYAMGMQLGQIVAAEPGSGYTFSLSSFGKYITPVYSSFNSTSKVSVNLTDYVNDIKNSLTASYDEDGNMRPVKTNSFVVYCYDYAMNTATYEIRLPDEILSMYFNEEEYKLSPNETLDARTALNIYPSESWFEVLDFTTSDFTVADVVNGTILAKKSGSATITAVGYDADGNKVTAQTLITVLAPGDEGYNGRYTTPSVNKFVLTGYKTEKAYYKVNSSDREIGVTGGTYEFGSSSSLSMFPSESVTLKYVIDSYYPQDQYPDMTRVEFSAGNSKVASVDENGVITAVAEGETIVTARVIFNGRPSLSRSVTVKVKDPFTTQSIYLMSYNGNGGEVVIPSDRGITTIYSYAFTGYEYVDKDLENGDVIDEEDPYYIKQMYLGEDTITKVVIPEGVTEIQSYAFTGLTALEEVVLPSTLTKIGLGAFMNCEKLKTINLENAKFINERAFYACALEEIDLTNVVSIGNYTFAKNYIVDLKLPACSQSLGTGAFSDNQTLTNVRFEAEKMKIGPYAFARCIGLTDIDINAAVVSAYAFEGCSSLTNVTLGKDVAVIGEFAFANTNASKFNLDFYNTTFKTDTSGAFVYTKDGSELVLVAPKFAGSSEVTVDAQTIASGAFSGNTKVTKVVAPNLTTLGSYAFAYCDHLVEVQMPNLQTIGDFAFALTALNTLPSMDNVTSIGTRAFFGAQLTSVAIPENCQVGNYAFAYNQYLTEVTIGDNAQIGEACFYCPMTSRTYEATQSLANYTAYTYQVEDSNGQTVDLYYYSYNFISGVTSRLTSLTVGKDVQLGAYAFSGNGKLAEVTLGDNAQIGEACFFNCGSLTTIDLSKASAIGNLAFSGSILPDLMRSGSNYANAFEYVTVNGKLFRNGYVYSSFAPKLTSVDVTGAQKVGEGAFANQMSLTSAALPAHLTAIPARLFANAKSLKNFEFGEQVTEIGENAFYRTGLETVDITKIVKIGDYGLYSTKLAAVTLADEAELGEAAFGNCFYLETVDNLAKATVIGDYAFVNSALTELNLESATVIGDFAFRSAPVTKVTFGTALEHLGENPFASCPIETYAKIEDVIFNGKVVGTEKNATYTVSEKVFVEDDAVYMIAPNGGYVLVSYPMASERTDFTVKEGTTRISAMAFAGSGLMSATLPVSLKSLGDKAFYGAENLKMITFLSYSAPDFEEEYDTQYANYNNMAFTGRLGEYEGLGIIGYYMWNYTSSMSSFFFGANFVDYIGHIENKLVMVKPKNGVNYQTFITEQYFNTFVDGSFAPTDVTLTAISLIDLIPSFVTLSDEQTVVNARKAYDKISSAEQIALVNNYQALIEAEDAIEYLKAQEDRSSSDSSDQSSSSSAEENAKNGNFFTDNLFGLILAIVIAAAFAAYVVVTKKGKGASGEQTATDNGDQTEDKE